MVIAGYVSGIAIVFIIINFILIINLSSIARHLPAAQAVCLICI